MSVATREPSGTNSPRASAAGRRGLALPLIRSLVDRERDRHDILVAMARGIHLFPSRTEKLSPVTPMVLPKGGRVGSRRFSSSGKGWRLFSLLVR